MVADLSQSNARAWVRKAFASLAQLSGRVPLALDGWRERSKLRHEFDGHASTASLSAC